MTTLHEIRRAYLAFCAQNHHAVIPSAPIMPENDPTTLFTSSGMQPLLPYLLGQKHPMGTRVANSQKCFRAEDITDIGDNRHTTFFEMLGNWSFGDYFKEEQLRWFFVFLVDTVGLDPSRLYVTCFVGDATARVPQDTDAAAIWQGLFAERGIAAPIVTIGSEERGGVVGMQGGRIFYYDAKKNWWSRAGVPENMPAGEPGGPDSEVFYDFGTPHDPAFGAACHPNCDCGRFMEIGNSVFMEYVKNSDGSFGKLPQRNVDFGGGLERIAAAARGDADVFRIDIFAPLIVTLERLSGVRYADPAKTYAFRVIADHVRAAVFMIADGIMPSNKEQGYVLRRLLRRAIVHSNHLGIDAHTLGMLAEPLLVAYEGEFPLLHAQHAQIVAVIEDEERKFRSALTKGLREFDKVVARSHEQISGTDAFILVTTYGFPLEVMEELAAEKNVTVDRSGFADAMAAHQEQSRTAAAQKFKGGLADHDTQTTALHTATHLLLAALRKELGAEVHQAGSNITAERTRFDFTYPQKVPRDALDRIEAFVNDAIAKKCSVRVTEMNKEDARAAGVEGSFWEKYPDRVTVYTIADADGVIYSQELCGGPHVATTEAMTGTFRILKEEASSAGVRRIKAVLIM